MAFMFLRETIRTYRERDPAARSSLEVLLCYPGPACRHVASVVTLAMAARPAPAGPLLLPYRPLADRHRDPSGRQDRPAAGHRPRHGRGDRRDRRDRRRLLPVPSGHLGRRPRQRRQAAPDRWQQRDHRRRRQGAGTDQGGRQRPGRLERRRAGQRARRHHRRGHPGPAGRSRADARAQGARPSIPTASRATTASIRCCATSTRCTASWPNWRRGWRGWPRSRCASARRRRSRRCSSPPAGATR